MTDVRYEFDRCPSELDRLIVCEWLKNHGIDPNTVAVPGWIELRPERRQVSWLGFVWETVEDGTCRRVPKADRSGVILRGSVLQLESRPMPFPLSPQEPHRA